MATRRSYQAVQRFFRIVLVCVLAGMLVCLFLPAFQDYDRVFSLGSIVLEQFRLGHMSEILCGSLYYVPVIAAGLLVALLDGRLRYAISLLACVCGFTLMLVQYFFLALESSYLFGVYLPGLYVLAGLQLLGIVLSIVALCSKDAPVYLDPALEQKNELPPLG